MVPQQMPYSEMMGAGMIPNKKLLKTQIVVVEDDEILSATIHKYLSSKGFNVSCFNSAEAFEEYINANEEFQNKPKS